MAACVDQSVSSGTFSLHGQTFEVENDIWVVGDDVECVVIDAPHSVDGILAVVGDRRVKGIVRTHPHDDHVRAPRAARAGPGPILLHPADKLLWELTHGASGDSPGVRWDEDLDDGQRISVGGTTLEVLHTPGHAPGAACLYARDLGCVFTGDTLFNGGAGATGGSCADGDLILESIRARLFTLPAYTVVLTQAAGRTAAVECEREPAVLCMIRQPLTCQPCVDGRPSRWRPPGSGPRRCTSVRRS